MGTGQVLLVSFNSQELCTTEMLVSDVRLGEVKECFRLRMARSDGQFCKGRNLSAADNIREAIGLPIIPIVPLIRLIYQELA